MVGIRCVVYLDDFLLVHQNEDPLRSQVVYTLDLLDRLGWQINLKNAQLNPAQKLTFLGISWDTRLLCIPLPPEKVLDLPLSIQRILSHPVWSRKSAQDILAILNFASFPIPLGKLHLRSIQLASRRLPRLRPRQEFPICPKAIAKFR